jgi:hypothetical protein
MEEHAERRREPQEEGDRHQPEGAIRVPKASEQRGVGVPGVDLRVAGIGAGPVPDDEQREGADDGEQDETQGQDRAS